VRGIGYVVIEGKLANYSASKNNNYLELLGKLGETSAGILEGKIVGDIDLFEDVVGYLGEGELF